MQARSAKWAANPPRQPNLVAPFLKGILAHYKLRIPENEPVTVGRIRQPCRRVGIRCEDTVGCSIERFIELNKGCASWWLVAQALETSNIEVADRAAEVHPN